MHEHHKMLESDDNFENGTLYHLVANNEGRVLDGRRTPGFIESYDEESEMFIWRITDFEDKGRCWEVPVDEIGNYQFRKNSKLLSVEETEKISKHCLEFHQILTIEKNDKIYQQTLISIQERKEYAKKWLKQNSLFLKNRKELDFNMQVGDCDLHNDLKEYMKSLDLYELELKTANQYLLNPQSGEWIKGLKIVMAEMGLIDFKERIPRTKDIFLGMGEKSVRRNYIISRLAFIQSIFEILGIEEVPLYRGMSSSINLFETPSTLVSATFSADTAKDFASINDDSAYRSAYFVKFMYPITNLFMTFFETEQFNERYKEQEAIIIYRDKLSF